MSNIENHWLERFFLDHLRGGIMEQRNCLDLKGINETVNVVYYLSYNSTFSLLLLCSFIHLSLAACLSVYLCLLSLFIHSIICLSIYL